MVMEKAYLITHKTNFKSKLHWKVDRYYFWDAECEFNFMSLLWNKEIFQYLRDSRKPITLLTPHITQKMLGFFETFVEKNLDFFTNHITEIVVNDIWMLYRIKKSIHFQNIPCIYGNYLFWQVREPLAKTYTADENRVLSVDSPIYKDFLQTHNIWAIEVFNVFQWFEIQYLQDTKIHMYYPYVVHTMWRYCERSLLSLWETDLRVVSACSGCKGKEEFSFFHSMNNGVKNHKRWNKTFHINFSTKYITQADRLIYNYDFIKS